MANELGEEPKVRFASPARDRGVLKAVTLHGTAALQVSYIEMCGFKCEKNRSKTIELGGVPFAGPFWLIHWVILRSSSGVSSKLQIDEVTTGNLVQAGFSLGLGWGLYCHWNAISIWRVPDSLIVGFSDIEHYWLENPIKNIHRILEQEHPRA